jgi:inner membrane protein
MTARTHIPFGQFLYLLLLTTSGIGLNAANALAVAAGSVLPDIDTGASIVGHAFHRLSGFIERKFGHRTLTHSVAGLCLVALVVLPAWFLAPHIYLCFLAGWGSHAILDTMTINGARLFYPFSSVRCVFPFDVNNPGRYRTQTGSRSDMALGIIFLAGCIPTFFIANQGYERFVRVTQQSIEAAVRDYAELSRDHLVQMRVEAYSMLTREPLAGTFDVIGAPDPHTLVFLGTDGRLHSLGKAFNADYVAQSVVCFRSLPARTTVRTIDASNRLLAQLSSLVDSAARNYFFGTVTSIDRVSLPEHPKLFTPVTGSGSTIRFNFARPEDVRDLNLDYTYISRGIITVRSVWSGAIPDTAMLASVLLPGPDLWLQMVFVIEQAESVQFVKHLRDTVHDGDVMARKYIPHFFDDEMALIDDKREAVKNRTEGAVQDLEQKIAGTEIAVQDDSVEYCNAQGLAARGFLDRSSLEPFSLKWRKEMRTLRLLEHTRRNERTKAALELSRLALAGEQLRAKEEVTRRQSALRSSADGVIAGIRRLPVDNKTRLVFIMRRLLR